MNCAICTHLLPGFEQTCQKLCGLGARIARDWDIPPQPTATAVIDAQRKCWVEPPPPPPNA